MSERYPGGIISKNAPTVTANPPSAPGVWTMDQQATYAKAGTWPFGGPFVYIEDVFQTWLYTGNGSTQTITNGVDLAGKGGLVWTKTRNQGAAGWDHVLMDTVRGLRNGLNSNLANANTVYPADTITSWNSNGYSLGADASSYLFNAPGGTYTYASWTFRKQPKFFDVVTYTGTGANTTIAHNLGSVPGCIIVKRTDTTGNWQVYHNGLTSAAYSIQLNLTNAQASATTVWNSTAPTSTVFSVGTDATVNASGGTYVAYLFAHNAGGFGTSGTDNVISCGSFTDSGAGTVTLGYEPQWLLLKKISAVDDWIMVDNMRGWSTNSTGNSKQAQLFSNLTNAEGTVNTGNGVITPTGFTTTAAGATYIYIAIRLGPMKTPTSGTSVYQALTYAGDNSTTTGQTVNTAFPMDFAFTRYNRTGAGDWDAISRLQGLSTAASGSRYLNPYNTNVEATGGYLWQVAQTQLKMYGFPTTTTQLNHFFRRAPGFFDEVCYTGDNGTNRALSHNLQAVPELVIIKCRSIAADWLVWTTSQAGKGANLNNTNLFFTNANIAGSSTWTSSTIYIKNPGYDGNGTNGSGQTYVAYLFASCPGVSKVGSYSGTGATQTISCGFVARFVMIKRTDSTGDWWVWDTARGMVAGTDPRLAYNSTAAETNANWVYTDASGFQIVTTDATVNASGGTYIYLAIA